MRGDCIGDNEGINLRDKEKEKRMRGQPIQRITGHTGDCKTLQYPGGDCDCIYGEMLNRAAEMVRAEAGNKPSGFKVEHVSGQGDWKPAQTCKHGVVRDEQTFCSACYVDAEIGRQNNTATAVFDAVRKFETGATRNTDAGKYDYEGFMHPLVIEAFAAYMHVNRFLADGTTRDSDNWQKGIPFDVYAKSEWRHHHEFWKIARGIPSDEGELAAIMGTVFNLFGFAHERMKADPGWLKRELAKYQAYRNAELAAREAAKKSKP